METKIQKWGNSLGVRIPKTILENKELTEGSKVVVSENPKGILITSEKKSETLQDLIDKITDENRHEELEWGPPRGKEIW